MLKQLIRELRRRRVPQVAGFYLAGGWVVFEVADAAFPRLGLPDWTVTFVLVLILLAFPLVVGLAWFYDITPEGVRRTGPAGDADHGPDRVLSDALSAVASSAHNHAFGRVAVTGAIIILALAGGAFVLFGRGGPEAELAPNAMMVFPFTVRGGEDVDVLAEGMVELLSAKLDGIGELRSADPSAVLRLVGDEVDPADARSVARRLGAGYYVVGSVLEFSGDLRLQASIYRTDGKDDPVAESSVEGPANTFLALVDELAAVLLVGGDFAPPGRMPRIAAMTTDNLDALRRFLEGERLVRETRYGDAIERFERAVEADSAFGLAYYRLAVAASWAERPALTSSALDAAQRHEARLGERDRALLAAFAARQRGRNAEALSRYRALVASYPEDMEAWYELGEVEIHNGSFLGVPVEEMAGPFARTVAMDPGYGAALFHLTNVLAWTRDTTALDSVTGLFRQQLGGAAPLSIEAQWAFVSGDSAARARVLDQVVADHDGTALVFAALATDDANELRNVMTAEERMGLGEAGEPLAEVLAAMLASFGARREALDWLEQMEAAGPEAPIRTTIVATFPFLRTSPERLERLRAGLLAWDPGEPRMEDPGPRELASLAAIYPQLREYLLALVELRLGHPGEAIRRADELEAMDGAPVIRALAADFARHVRAQVNLEQGRPGEALRIIQGGSIWSSSPWDERVDITYGYAGGVLLRAEALQELGRYREAIRWFSTVAMGPHAMGYVYYRIGQCHEALGDREQAARSYARFLTHWTDPDPVLEDLGADARRRLEALTGEG